LVVSVGLQAIIKLPGSISEFHEVYAACDLYVNSSRWEGLPMTLLELMAHGKPMVATDVGGNAEVVHDGITGILVLPEDPDKLSGAIIQMLKDDSLGERAGNVAHYLIRNILSIKALQSSGGALLADCVGEDR